MQNFVFLASFFLVEKKGPRKEEQVHMVRSAVIWHEERGYMVRSAVIWRGARLYGEERGYMVHQVLWHYVALAHALRSDQNLCPSLSRTALIVIGPSGGGSVVW
jgi:hypothetical protein